MREREINSIFRVSPDINRHTCAYPCVCAYGEECVSLQKCACTCTHAYLHRRSRRFPGGCISSGSLSLDLRSLARAVV